MDKNKIFTTLKSIKELPSFSRAIPIALSVWILSLTAYYCINAPWLSFLSAWRPDTKELIAETLKFQWVPVFLSRLPYVLYALILNFIALLIGNRILRWLKVDFDSNIEKLIFSIPLGWGIYSIGIFYLGVSGLLYKEAVYLFLTLLGVLSILEIKRFFSEWKARATPTLPSPLEGEGKGEGARFKFNKTDLIFLPIIIIFLAVQLIASFSPVVVGDLYHIGLPKLYIRHHAIIHIPGYFYSTFPAHTEMLYLLGLITAGETLSKLFSFGISLLFLISIFSIGTKYFSKVVGYLAGVIIMTEPTYFVLHFSELWVDAALALFSLLGVYAFFMWIEGRKEGYLYLSAICCALAGATKIQGLFFVLLFFVGFLITVKMDKRFLKKLAWCISAVCIIASPWYTRSWWLTGDPIFPFLYKYLGASASSGWNEYSNACFWEYHSLCGGAKSFSDFARIYKDLFFTGIYVHRFPPIIGLFLIPAVMTIRNWSKSIRYLFFITQCYLIFCIFSSDQIRFLYLAIALLSIIVASFIKMVWTKYSLTRIPIILCIVGFSVAYFPLSFSRLEGAFFTGLGVIDQRQLLNEYSHCRASAWINENLPQNSKILSWQQSLGYFLDRGEYIEANPIVQGVLDFSRITDATTFLKSIKELGITHLLYCNASFMPFNRYAREILDKCVSELFENGKIILIKQIDGSAIYSVEVPPNYFILEGNTLRFSDKSQRKHLVKGWSSPEEWGTWSEGEESVILVNFKGLRDEIVRHGESASGATSSASNGPAMTNNRDYTMIIKATGFSVPGKQQGVKIYLDDNLLGEHTFTHPVTYFEELEVKIPSATLFLPSPFEGEEQVGGNHRIKFVYSFTGSPAEYGMGPDVRQLAMGVSSIGFK